MTVVRRADLCCFAPRQAAEGDAVTLRAELRGVRDGAQATLKIFEKRWRAAADTHLTDLNATVSGGAVEARWTVPAPATAPARGDSGRREFYFIVQAGALLCTSSLLAVTPPPRRNDP